jgi:signal transduction histidine kinase
VLLAKTLTSSTFKLALIAIGTFGVIVSAIFSYVYLSTSAFVRSRSDRAITAEYIDLQDVYGRSGRDALISLIRQRMSDTAFAGHAYVLSDRSSAVLAGNLGEWPATATAPLGWTEFRASAGSPEGTGGPLMRGMIDTFASGDRLLVGRDISDLDGFTRKIETAVISGISLIFVLAGLASVLVTRRTVGRIEQINATSRAIMASGLDKRIPLRGTNDEWDRVAENLNLMLDRIETLMGEVKQVSDNLAHDLRTPLTRMRGRLEMAYNLRRFDEDAQMLIGDTMADLDAVLRIFTSITRIAQIEAQVRKEGFRTVNLVEIAHEVVELYDAAAEQRGSFLSMTGNGEVLAIGDRDLIFDAIANLVDNAIKHGHNGGQVVVACETVDGGAVVSITDNGPGIPADQREQVFKRFYRLEQSRYTPGNGLGLSLVSAVARLHGARIEMFDNSPGLQFKLWFSALVTQRQYHASQNAGGAPELQRDRPQDTCIGPQ